MEFHLIRELVIRLVMLFQSAVKDKDIKYSTYPLSLDDIINLYVRTRQQEYPHVGCRRLSRP